jgi:hypothetical protein
MKKSVRNWATHKGLASRASLLLVGILVVGVVAVLGTQKKEDTLAAGGWLSGACCEEAANGSFGNWRGEPVTIATTWGDTDAANQTYMWGMDIYTNWNQGLDIAPGFIAKGTSENMAGAASGAYEGRWRQAMANVRAKWGQKKVMYIRPAHEMNGNWYPWSVTPANVNDFKRAWVRYYNIIQQELVQKGYNAKVVINFNKDPVSSVPTEQMWPGDQYVDVVGVDFYDMWPSYPNQAAWDADFMATENGPRGLGTWQQFARSHGKPLSFPEWGANPGSLSDNPFYIQKMHQFFTANAGTGPGQVLYEIYFNTNANGVYKGAIYPSTLVPNAAAMYRSLTFGGGGVVSPSPTPTPPTPTPPTPTPPAPTPTPPTPTNPVVSQTGNLASGKTFTSSVGAHPNEPNNPASNVNDKNESTRWVSAPTDNTTLSTDLGSSYTLNKVSVLWAADTVKSYDLQVSTNNSTWTTVASGQTNNSQRQLIDTTSFSSSATGRYFRIVAKDRWNTGYGNSVWEIGLYGTASTTNPAPTPPPPTPTPGNGDANGDGRVNGIDYSILSEKDGTNFAAADFNRDGTVGAADLAILLSRWTW